MADLDVGGVTRLQGLVKKYDVPQVTPGRARQTQAADDDLPSITFSCEKGILLEPLIVVKLRSLKANTPVVTDPANLMLQFTLAVPVSVTVAASRAVATTKTLTLILRSEQAFQKLSKWLDDCHVHFCVGGTDTGRREPAPSPPRRMIAYESPARASPVAAPTEVVASSPAAIDQHLVALGQTDFDELLVRVLQLRIQRLG